VEPRKLHSHCPSVTAVCHLLLGNQVRQGVLAGTFGDWGAASARALVCSSRRSEMHCPSKILDLKVKHERLVGCIVAVGPIRPREAFGTLPLEHTFVCTCMHAVCRLHLAWSTQADAYLGKTALLDCDLGWQSRLGAAWRQQPASLGRSLRHRP